METTIALRNDSYRHSVDFFKLAADYPLLNSRDRQSVRYVSSLIGGGSLTVREHEEWKGYNTKPRKGKGILITIDYQLQHIFNLGNYPQPDARIVDLLHDKAGIVVSKWRLIIGHHTRLRLYNICREAYDAQRFRHPDSHRWAQALISMQHYARQ